MPYSLTQFLPPDANNGRVNPDQALHNDLTLWLAEVMPDLLRLSVFKLPPDATPTIHEVAWSQPIEIGAELLGFVDLWVQYSDGQPNSRRNQAALILDVEPLYLTFLIRRLRLYERAFEVAETGEYCPLIVVALDPGASELEVLPQQGFAVLDLSNWDRWTPIEAPVNKVVGSYPATRWAYLDLATEIGLTAAGVPGQVGD